MRKFHPAATVRAVAYYRRNGDTERAERLEEMLAAYGMCKRCGRKLTDPTSVERGTGPECATKDQLGRVPSDPPHRVVLGPTQPWYDDRGEPRAWCTKDGCRWTWAGVGSFDHVKRQHEQLNDPTATTTEEDP
jgi:hypothetical protein